MCRRRELAIECGETLQRLDKHGEALDVPLGGARFSIHEGGNPPLQPRVKARLQGRAVKAGGKAGARTMTVRRRRFPCRATDGIGVIGHSRLVHPAPTGASGVARNRGSVQRKPMRQSNECVTRLERLTYLRPIRRSCLTAGHKAATFLRGDDRAPDHPPWWPSGHRCSAQFRNIARMPETSVQVKNIFLGINT